MKCIKILDQKAERWVNTLFSGIALIIGLLSFSAFSKPVQAEQIWTGSSIMNEVFKRHDLFPYIFEDQTIILTDDAGNYDVRKARRFSRVEKNGTVKYLLIFDNPPEVCGVALLAIRQNSGGVESWIYLPASGKKMKSNAREGGGNHVLGTDFTIEDLEGEVLSNFRYVRMADRKIDKIDYFVVEAFPQDEKIKRSTGYSLRRFFIQQDNFSIIRIDYFNRRGRFIKRQTRCNLKRVDDDMWCADMILMENYRERHKTLIKINRRVFSHDYVPPEMFTSAWLLENRHVQTTERLLFMNITKTYREDK